MSLGNVHLTPQLVQAVRDAVDIVGIASQHTKLRQAGRRWQGLCPLHKEKSPSFSVDPDQGLFYCFGCGKGGDAIKLHMLLSGDDFPAAIEALALRHGIPLPSRAERTGAGPGGRGERDLTRALEAAQAFFTAELRRHDMPRRYLEERGIPAPLVERFGLGYAPESWDALQAALRQKVSLGDLEAAGLVGRSERLGTPYDRFRHRLMFPIHSPAGRLVGFGGRTLGDDKAKYVNTAETEQFHKGRLLYGLHQAKREVRESGRAVLVEGYFDVIGAVACGLEGAVAGMGTALTPEQARLLARYAEEVVIAYDGDAAGEGAARRALPLLLVAGLAVRRARFPAGHDPDSLRQAEGEEAVRAAVEGAEDALLLEIERAAPADAAADPQAAAAAARAVRELGGAVPDPVARHQYVERAAERLRVAPRLILGRERPAGRAGEVQLAVRPRELVARPRDPAASVVRSLEESALDLLLRGRAVPPAGDLPPEDVFLDVPCRNIYRAFCALHGSGRGGGLPPDGRMVLAELGSDTAAVDRMAQILVEVPVGSKEVALPDLLAELTRRWQEKRLRDLASEISEAQRTGDDAKLLALYEEKRRLSLSLHRRSRPGPAGGVE